MTIFRKYNSNPDNTAGLPSPDLSPAESRLTKPRSFRHRRRTTRETRVTSSRAPLEFQTSVVRSSSRRQPLSSAAVRRQHRRPSLSYAPETISKVLQWRLISQSAPIQIGEALFGPDEGIGPRCFLAGAAGLLGNFTLNYGLYLNLDFAATTDKNALVQFKTSITSDPYRLLATNWSIHTSSSSVCQWIGVSCGTEHNNRVTGLNISGFGLRGTLSPHLGNLTFLKYLDISYNNFTGPIPRELSRLRRLRSIDMGFNSFAGQIPTWFGAFPQLEIMRLNNNTFTGAIPQELSLLQGLRHIDMEANSLTGQIPVWFGALPQLERLNLRNNKLNGKIPEEIGNCSSLQILYLTLNQLTGSIPYIIFNLSSIREIRASFNHLSGTLPSDMCNNLPNLTFLSVSSNQLEGTIPPNIGNCTNLEVLSLSINRFNGIIPTEIASLSMLKELYLGANEFKGNLLKELNKLAFLEAFFVGSNQLSGSIPQLIFNISTLKVLDLTDNHFTGSLPLSPELSLSNLRKLYLWGNKLNGEIPISINNASNLYRLELEKNLFSGSIPNLGSLRLLRRLYIWGNSLSGLGFISSLANCQFLEYLEISENPLNGILPDSIGNLSKSLTGFQAYDCNINGVIPSTIGNLIGLQLINLSENQITGVIPPTLGKLNRLQRLSLHANQLHGFIPQDICGMSNIGELYLDENNLTGPIPECFGELKSLRYVYLGSNKLNSSIPLNFWNLKDLLFLNLSSNRLSGQLPYEIAGLRQLNQLDLSYNQFSGDIPRSIDGCESLTSLNLSDNKFERSIPPSLGNIRNLMALDLSNNNISGLIPESLQGLKFLQYFNVSYNKLEGMIPTGGPFVNITSQSFLHNSALCGDQRFQVPPCIGNNLKKNSRLKKVDRLMKYIVPPFISVIILTAIILLVLVRTRKPKRVLAPTDDVLLGVTWRRISYIELVRGTDAFNETNLLGNGSFGSVFKGVLSDGLNVAVKVFNSQLERVIRSFDTECEILSSIRHRNLVQIIGCCSNTEFKALILGFMPNGSLEKWLHLENCVLDLISRLQIAIDVALALEYLHHGHTFPVVHCDIKPSNVLLDEDMVAHLCDFGIAKLFDDGENIVLTKTLGTIGYAAPEYGSGGRVSTSADVYSYGILLLEMFTSKKPTDDIFNEEMSLKEWVLEAIQENTVAKIVGPNLLASEDQNFHAKEECFSSIFGLAMKCLAVMPDERINMMETTATLQRIKAKFVADTTNHQQYALSIISRQ
ncbi:Probable LRR receptor-like serine/threonine-protein kinase [Striga hermonthica]|uniref:non-specific serine/threonine protein kinase n=1 Tax=Striga hermonthica TaxID=68872 RepID=A0A9N7R440_STRHE|nr:Probable LRR receptor-like serine/threonine-protein kinase [Striga hermonthica]